MISIIVPTLNESQNLEILFKRIAKLHLKNYEIIVADSNSKDDTVNMAKRLASRYGWPIRAIQTGNTDLSNAIVNVLPKTKGEIVVVMDADLQHLPELIPKLIKNLEKGNDIVIASRLMKGSKVNFGLWRTFVSRVFCFLAHIAVPKTSHIKDPSTGFFAFRRSVIKKTKLKPQGFKILLEILAKGDYNKVVEIPFNFKNRERGKSKFSLKQTILAVRHLLKLAIYSKEHKRFLKFGAVGLSGIFVNEGLLWLLTEFAGLFYLFSSIIAIEISILSNFILNDIWTFKRERKGKFLMRLGKFNLARIFTLIINFGALWILTSLGLHYLVSNLIGIALATIFAYLISLWWVWK